MLDKKIKRKWCASLRGGTWTQIAGQFNNADRGRCALGILAELVKQSDEWPYNGLRDWRDSGNMSKDDYDKIASMNDSGKSFSEIADWIEQNL